MNRILPLLILCLVCVASLKMNAQLGVHQQRFSRADTLRGSITPERAWWDLQFYHLALQVMPETKTIKGSNTIRYKVIAPAKKLQVDLQAPLVFEKAVQNGEELPVEKISENVYLVTPGGRQTAGTIHEITVHYSGKPREAKRPPWDGGFQWTKDKDGNHFIATSCQGLGASAWWPCKDHMYDEPDSMRMDITVPKPLVDVSNGRLRKVTENADNTRTFSWFVSNPINNYGVNVNIGPYVKFSDVYQGEKGKLDLDYFVQPQNLEKAKVQFKQVNMMLQAFEHWFGPYPFYEDAFKLVEVPYLGMEHQSSVTYGNRYQNGYLGNDLSGSGVGLRWDYIIIHESGHEWFANNITYKDIADMWVHEGFTCYSETLFTEYHFGKEAATAYVTGLRKNIQNDRPVIGQYGVNAEGSSDMYYKGANMLHTIRQVIDNDVLFREILRGLNKDYYHQTVTSAEVEEYINKKSGINFNKVFDQYLRDIRIPVLEYRVKDAQLFYRWTNCVNGFDLPLYIFIDGKKVKINPLSTQWKKINMKDTASFESIPDFYVQYKKIGSSN